MKNGFLKLLLPGRLLYLGLLLRTNGPTFHGTTNWKKRRDFFFWLGKLNFFFQNSLYFSPAGSRVHECFSKKCTLLAFTKSPLSENINICIACLRIFWEKCKRMKVPFWQNFAIFVNPKKIWTLKVCPGLPIAAKLIWFFLLYSEKCSQSLYVNFKLVIYLFKLEFAKNQKMPGQKNDFFIFDVKYLLKFQRDVRTRKHVFS